MEEANFNISYELNSSPALKLWTTQCVKQVVFTNEKYEKPQNTIKEEIRPQETQNYNLITIELFKKLFVDRTLDQCRQEAKAPQRSKEWHDARRYCITASCFGAAIGHNPYCSPQSALIEKIWASFIDSESTRYGTFHEKDAQDSFMEALKNTTWLQDLYDGYTSYFFLEVGLLKSHKDPWIAVSPDGLLIVNGPKGLKIFLIEFKCPASQRDSALHPYRKYNYNVPEYYMDQIQGIMGLLNKHPELLKQVLFDQMQKIKGVLDDFLFNNIDFDIQECLFVVWQPKQMHVTRIPFQAEYYLTILEPNLKKWHEEFISYSVLKLNGQLVKNSLEKILIL